MKRLGQRMFNALCAMSLVVCVVAVILGARSFWMTEQLQFRHRGERCRLYIAHGTARIDNQPQNLHESDVRNEQRERLDSLTERCRRLADEITKLGWHGDQTA